MSRPRTAPGRARPERAQSVTGGARVFERGEDPGEVLDEARVQKEKHRLERASEAEATDSTLRRSADIEELQNQERVAELTSVQDEEPGTLPD